MVKRASEKVNYFYDAVLIDEFQDFREHNYELIVAMAKRLENVILVGDYYQHSVLGKNNSGKPFKKKQGDIGYDEFIAELRRLGFSVDPTSLDKSRRCSVDICKYVTKKLGINIKSNGDHTGKVIWIEEDRAAQILEDSRILKLVNKESDKYSFSSMNWSYSKGDTVDACCVILTGNLDNMDEEDFSAANISTVTRNRLYVAMTRSRGDLYLMKNAIFNKVKSSYVEPRR